MSKFGLSLLVIIAVALMPLYAAAAEKIGVVDGMDIVSKSAEGKRVQGSIKSKSEELGKPVAAKRAEIQRQMEEFQKQASMMKEDARKRKATELEQKMKDFEKQGATAEKQLSDFQEKQLGPLYTKLQSAVQAVAQDMKLDIVLDKRQSGLLYMNPSVDITDKVRSKFGG
jgi:outer membrane protein